LNITPPDPFYDLPYEHGASFLAAGNWLLDMVESGAAANFSMAGFARIAKKKYLKLLRGPPVIDLDKAVLGKERTPWCNWIRDPTNHA
jgi:hypothetical protein